MRVTIFAVLACLVMFTNEIESKPLLFKKLKKFKKVKKLFKGGAKKLAIGGPGFKGSSKHENYYDTNSYSQVYYQPAVRYQPVYAYTYPSVSYVRQPLQIEYSSPKKKTDLLDIAKDKISQALQIKSSLGGSKDNHASDYDFEFQSAPVIDISSSRVDYSPPRFDYSPPRVDYSPLRVDYSPPRVDYSPPRVDYSPPKVDFSPPTIDYSPPKMDFSPPTIDYSPPRFDFSPPTIDYTPPRMDFSPPKFDFSGPKINSPPPRVEYSAPPAQYSPPLLDYSPPSVSYGVPAATSSSYASV